MVDAPRVRARRTSGVLAVSVAGFGDELAAALPELRQMAESRMGSSNGASDATVRRKTGRKVQSEATGLEVPEWATVHTGPMRLAGASRGASSERTYKVPGGEQRQAQREAHFPAAVDVIRDWDLIEITAGENKGTVWMVLEADFADQQTARRLPVVAEQRPSEWGAP